MKILDPEDSIRVDEIVLTAEIAIEELLVGGLAQLRVANFVWALTDSMVMDYGRQVRKPAEIFAAMQAGEV